MRFLLFVGLLSQTLFAQTSSLDQLKKLQAQVFDQNTGLPDVRVYRDMTSKVVQDIDQNFDRKTIIDLWKDGDPELLLNIIGYTLFAPHPKNKKWLKWVRKQIRSGNYNERLSLRLMSYFGPVQKDLIAKASRSQSRWLNIKLTVGVLSLAAMSASAEHVGMGHAVFVPGFPELGAIVMSPLLADAPVNSAGEMASRFLKYFTILGSFVAVKYGGVYYALTSGVLGRLKRFFIKTPMIPAHAVESFFEAPLAVDCEEVLEAT